MPPETTPAGATPVAEGATPSQTPANPAAPPSEPTPPAAAATTSATDDDEAALGDKGKRALDRMKADRDEAQRLAREAQAELETLRNASKSDAQKALDEAKAAGRAESRSELEAIVRNQGVREALLAAGVAPGLVKDLSKADEFASLKVTDKNELDEEALEAAVKAHKKRVPDAYATPGDKGSADGGSRGGKAPAGSLEDAIGAHYAG